MEFHSSHHVTPLLAGWSRQRRSETSVMRSRQFSPCHHRLQLAEGHLTTQVLHATVWRYHQLLRRQVLKCRANAFRNCLGRLNVRTAEVERPEHDGFACFCQWLQRREVEPGLRRLNRDLVNRTICKLLQIGVPI